MSDEAFTRLQYLQVQIGCFNRCAFCSQQAGGRSQPPDWPTGVAALADVTGRRGIRLGAERSAHRPGVLFP